MWTETSRLTVVNELLHNKGMLKLELIPLMEIYKILLSLMILTIFFFNCGQISNFSCDFSRMLTTYLAFD